MKALKVILGLLIVVMVLILVFSGCDNEDVIDSDAKESEDISASNINVNTLATGYGSEPEIVEEIIEGTPDLPVCGDAVCDKTELDKCEVDCPTCDDGDKCTIDFFNLEALTCNNKPIKNCCGDGICGPVESCAEDCPIKRITLASYPYPFVHGDELEADIVVGDGGTAKDVSAATAIATGIGISGTIQGTMESDITTIKDTTVILIGNPCTNGFIAQLMPFESDCLEDYEVGEARLSMFVTGKSESDETYALVVSGYSGEDIMRAGNILNEYEKNMAQLKGTEVKV